VKFGNLKNYLTGRAHMSAARFLLTAWDGRPVPHATPVPSGHAHHVESARHRWSPVVAAHVGWPLLSTALDVIRGSCRPFRFSPSLFGRTPRCSALHRPLLHPHCLSLTSRPKLSDRAKRSASSLCPSCAKSLPATSASEARPRDFPAAIFLHERLTGDSPL
jgi:hypothetical protein